MARKHLDTIHNSVTRDRQAGLFDHSPTFYTPLEEEDRAKVIAAFASIADRGYLAARCLHAVGIDLLTVRGLIGPERADEWAEMEFGWPPALTAVLAGLADRFEGDRPPPGFAFEFLFSLFVCWRRAGEGRPREERPEGDE
jgi:hypothetical protein